jgi:uncharacterized integral membrane protein (TIGR00698 family)
VRLPQWIPTRPDAAGILLAGFLGTVSVVLARVLPKSPLISEILIALVLGALIVNTPLRRIVGTVPPSVEREPDRYAAGLRFTSKWVLRLAIILMGLKVQAGFFARGELALIACVAGAALPSAFMVAHVAASAAGVRRPMGDLLAGGTMICGASAVNAFAPIAGAHRQEQGVAIAVVFLFSIFALFAFRPVAALVGLDPHAAGLWSGLAVNDLSSAIAVGAQMGDGGAEMAAASKSARILMLAPTLVVLSLMRKNETTPVSLRKSAIESLPGFLVGYVALAIARAAGDRIFGASAMWSTAVRVDQTAVELLLATVSAGIGLHLVLRSLLATGAAALVVGGATSLWMAGLTLAMVTMGSRGALSTAVVIGMIAVVAAYALYRRATAHEAEAKQLRRRFQSGAPLSLAEAMKLLDVLEADGAFAADDAPFRKLIAHIHPSVGELIPVRESPLPHGEGCRWITYWEGKSGWALVALCREPGSSTPIHAHPHRLIGKTIEGTIEELRFKEISPSQVEVTSREVLTHEQLVEADGLATLHVVRATGARTAIDLQFRGPEVGLPGRRLRTKSPLDFAVLKVGDRIPFTEEVDDRPGHAGEGAAVGRVPAL